jgi:hypothetical protein
MQFSPDDAAVFEQELILKGYKKYNQDFKNSDYTYWKSFHKESNLTDDENPGFQIGFPFYDLTPFDAKNKIHVACYFTLGNTTKIDRLDVEINDDRMTIEKFEKFCEDFYALWLQDTPELCL